jgi:adenosylcobyric acid synthase
VREPAAAAGGGGGEPGAAGAETDLLQPVGAGVEGGVDPRGERGVLDRAAAVALDERHDDVLAAQAGQEIRGRNVPERVDLRLRRERRLVAQPGGDLHPPVPAVDGRRPRRDGLAGRRLRAEGGGGDPEHGQQHQGAPGRAAVPDDGVGQSQPCQDRQREQRAAGEDGGQPGDRRHRGTERGPHELDAVADERPVEHGVERPDEHLEERHVQHPAGGQHPGEGAADGGDGAGPPPGQHEDEAHADKGLDGQAQERRGPELLEPVRQQEDGEHEEGGQHVRDAGLCMALPRHRRGVARGQVDGDGEVARVTARRVHRRHHRRSLTRPDRPATVRAVGTVEAGNRIRGLLVAGTTSDAGKSVVTAGICRWLARQDVRVAPFKAQNMSLNSAVVPDRAGSWAEIGRAQAMQAAAAGVAPEAAMNPVLLKPGGDATSQVVLLGRPIGEAGALDYGQLKPRLLAAVLESLHDLAGRHDVVVCEGAGSPTEINLRDGDIVNMGLARAAGLPVVVVGDIDRGGVFAAMYGTLALLDAADQAHLAGWVVNKFRGDQRLLQPGLDMLASVTGRPVFGVLPWVPGLWLDAEDSLDLAGLTQAGVPPAAGAVTGEPLTVAVAALPRLSNVTDVDALAAEPGVDVRLVSRPADLEAADLAVLPGTRATVADLAWLRQRGLAEAVRRRAAAGRPVLGICGGYQMLAREIADEVESKAGVVDGLDLLPIRVRFGREKVLGRPVGAALGERVEGYEIRHGVVDVEGGEPFLDGCAIGAVRGTSWHGIFENDAFRRAFLRVVAAEAGRGFAPSDAVSFAAVREARLDVLGDLVAAHLDTDAVLRLVDAGPPAALPFVPPGAPSLPSRPSPPSR